MISYFWSMPEQVFRFKQFAVKQANSAMKIGTDGILLGAWAELGAAATILDIGTGTGVVALMLAQRSKQTRIDAIEIEAAAAKEASDNFAASPWADRLGAYHTSLQDYHPPNNYDLIVSNPPYFQQPLNKKLTERGLARHWASLTFGELMGNCMRLFSPNASLAIIIPAQEFAKVQLLALEHGLHLYRKTNVLPTPNTAPKRCLLQYSRQMLPHLEDNLVIEWERHQYTPAYQALTRDFYLKM
ncbi:MAG: methyltransferase [Chitinophagales bacterium]|nr:methyltransferase [Chitinophagales bacterium]